MLYVLPLDLAAVAPVTGSQCSIQRPANCTSSNDLYWSKGFSAGIREFIRRTKPDSPKAKYIVPQSEIIEDVGNVPVRVVRHGAYITFFGSAKSNSNFQGAITISNSGKILSLGVMQPCTMGSANCSGDSFLLQIYKRSSPYETKVVAELRDWARLGADGYYRRLAKGAPKLAGASHYKIKITTFSYR